MNRKAWKWGVGVPAAMILVLGLLVGDVHRRAANVLDAHRADLEKNLKLYQARDKARPSAYAETIDGNAWDFYGPALRAIAAIPAEVAELVPEIKGLDDNLEEPAPDDHALHNLFRDVGPTLAQLKKGARCRIVDMPFRLYGPDSDWSAAGDLLRTSRFLAGALRHHHRMSTEGESLSLALVGLSLAQDYERGGYLLDGMVQNVAEGALIEALRETFESQALAPEDLASFAAGLDRLDNARPDILDSSPSEELYQRSVLLDAEWKAFASGGTNLGSSPKPPTPSWRCLFSQQITRAQALKLLSESFESVSEVRALAPWQRSKAALTLSQKSQQFENPLFVPFASSYRRALERDAQAQLGRALLRIAVAIAWHQGEKGRDPDRLEDLVPQYLPKLTVCPMTGLPLRYLEGKVWSVGKNGIDDGGTPGRNNDYDDNDGDVVWIVRRLK